MGNGSGASRNRHGLTGKRAAAYDTLTPAEKRAYGRARKDGAKHAAAMRRVGATPFGGRARTNTLKNRNRNGQRANTPAKTGTAKKTTTRRVSKTEAARRAGVVAARRERTATRVQRQRATAKTATAKKTATARKSSAKTTRTRKTRG